MWPTALQAKKAIKQSDDYFYCVHTLFKSIFWCCLASSVQLVSPQWWLPHNRWPWRHQKWPEWKVSAINKENDGSISSFQRLPAFVAPAIEMQLLPLDWNAKNEVFAWKFKENGAWIFRFLTHKHLTPLVFHFIPIPVYICTSALLTPKFDTRGLWFYRISNVKNLSPYQLFLLNWN